MSDFLVFRPHNTVSKFWFVFVVEASRLWQLRAVGLPGDLIPTDLGREKRGQEGRAAGSGSETAFWVFFV